MSDGISSKDRRAEDNQAAHALPALPAEVLAKIFCHLPDAQLVRLLQVCQPWAALNHREELWQELIANRVPEWKAPSRPRKSWSRIYFDQRRGHRARLRWRHEILLMELAGSRNIFTNVPRKGQRASNPGPLRTDRAGLMSKRLVGFGDELEVNYVSEASGVSILHVAAKCGAARCIHKLLENWPVNVELQTEDGYGFTPLHEAAHGGHKQAVKMLLKYGARRDVANTVARHAFTNEDRTTRRGPFTAEQWARVKGHDDVAALISAFKS